MPGFVLPDAPESLAGKAVRAWSAPVVIPTYEPMPADKNPMFLEKRVYQGSSGKVYPLPFVDRISTEKKDRAWQAIHIENEYVRLMILPEIGGRIHVGLDKTNGYDFFYRQNVIKPALVGLAGPWISGGVEFNWPQHHRPSTFMPVDTHIEEHADGSVTVWCSEHEPMNRMKGMHGVHLKPGSSLIELKVRLYNRTELPQTFLWWANVAARVHEQYQSFFPPDVQYVADHAKRAMSRFPLCEGSYYGIDYAVRAKEQEAGSKKQEDRGVLFPPGEYARNDLSWYANIPVPTSYMILGTKEDFFGGYDHHAQAGFVHVADHRISPGKKQWTWGNHPFGYAWDRNLTDPEDPNDSSPPYRRDKPAPYIELMAGVFTDNQPDFSYLMPKERREFSQYWYPIQKIGPVKMANMEAAVSVEISESRKSMKIGIAVTSDNGDVRVRVAQGGQVIHQFIADLSAGSPLVKELSFDGPLPVKDLRLSLHSKDEREFLTYQPREAERKTVPEAAKEPDLPENVPSIDTLYLIGLHLEQYRHATRRPEEYWREALRRDPGESRCNHALGLWHLRRGEFGKAVARLETAIQSVTKFNPNPRDGELFYSFGLALRHLGRIDDAYDAFSKAGWDFRWRNLSTIRLIEIDCLRGDVEAMRKRTGSFLIFGELGALAARKFKESGSLFSQASYLARDPLDWATEFILEKTTNCDMQTALDISLDFVRGGFYEDAIGLLQTTATNPRAEAVPSGADTLRRYYLAFFFDKLGKSGAAEEARKAAASASPDYCFPHRLEEIAILLDAIEKNPADARAPYYLGNLLYDKRRHEEAISWWEKAAKLDRNFPTVWRNLGIGYYNILHDKDAAKGAYQRAFRNSLTWGVEGEAAVDDEEEVGAREGGDVAESEPSAGDGRRGRRHHLGDARVLYERDQLWKRTQETPERRLGELEQYMHLVRQRDDLTLEYCALLNQLGRAEEALEILKGRQFQPWEGGEGVALGQWVRAHLVLGRSMLWRSPADGGSAARALGLFEAGLNPPENLGEAFHLLQNNSELHYWAGVAAKAAGDKETRGKGEKEMGGVRHFEIAAASVGDFQGMEVRAYSEATVWAGLALRELGREGEARQLFEGMLAYAEGLKGTKAKIDYFATSLPTMLIFDEDIQERQNRQATLIEALARYGLGGDNGRNKSAARRSLGDLLQANPSDAQAADLLVALDWTA